jgi:hypothetical protein
MGDVLDFTGPTLHDIDPQKVLDAVGARQSAGSFRDLVVFGIDEDGDVQAFASTGTLGDTLMLLEKLKAWVVEHG